MGGETGAGFPCDLPQSARDHHSAPTSEEAREARSFMSGLPRPRSLQQAQGKRDRVRPDPPLLRWQGARPCPTQAGWGQKAKSEERKTGREKQVSLPQGGIRMTDKNPAGAGQVVCPTTRGRKSGTRKAGGEAGSPDTGRDFAPAKGAGFPPRKGRGISALVRLRSNCADSLPPWRDHARMTAQLRRGGT